MFFHLYFFHPYFQKGTHAILSFFTSGKYYDSKTKRNFLQDTSFSELIFLKPEPVDEVSLGVREEGYGKKERWLSGQREKKRGEILGRERKPEVPMIVGNVPGDEQDSREDGPDSNIPTPFRMNFLRTHSIHYPKGNAKKKYPCKTSYTNVHSNIPMARKQKHVRLWRIFVSFNNKAVNSVYEAWRWDALRRFLNLKAGKVVPSLPEMNFSVSVHSFFSLGEYYKESKRNKKAKNIEITLRMEGLC